MKPQKIIITLSAAAALTVLYGYNEQALEGTRIRENV
jgi:hypothetical protein